MSWFASIIVGLLTAVAGTLASGYIANHMADWYRVSGVDGGAGYFVVMLTLLGGVAGPIIGLVASRTVGSGVEPSFVRALGVSLGVVLTSVGVVGGTARFFADVPPEIDGDADAGGGSAVEGRPDAGCPERSRTRTIRALRY